MPFARQGIIQETPILEDGDMSTFEPNPGDYSAYEIASTLQRAMNSISNEAIAKALADSPTFRMHRAMSHIAAEAVPKSAGFRVQEAMRSALAGAMPESPLYRIQRDMGRIVARQFDRNVLPHVARGVRNIVYDQIGPKELANLNSHLSKIRVASVDVGKFQRAIRSLNVAVYPPPYAPRYRSPGAHPIPDELEPEPVETIDTEALEPLPELENFDAPTQRTEGGFLWWVDKHGTVILVFLTASGVVIAAMTLYLNLLIYLDS